MGSRKMNDLGTKMNFYLFKRIERSSTRFT